MARERDPDRIERPDVEIGAAFSAKRLRFKRDPDTEVEVHGEFRDDKLREAERRGELRDAPPRAEIETASGSKRERLPDEVEPGVTYRDVRVGWRAAAKIVEPDDGEEEHPRRRPSS